MKKQIVALILILALTVSTAAALTSCSGKDDKLTTTAASTAASVTQAETGNAATTDGAATTLLSEKTEDVGSSTTLAGDADGSSGAVITTQKYRVRYYDITAPFADLVGKPALRAWQEEYIFGIGPDEVTEMTMKRFIQYFDISREDFDRANEEFARRVRDKLSGVPVINPKDYTNQELEEVYNADIIYTFDDEIINAYYLSHDYPFLYRSEYEDALAAGTYQTRSERYVTVTPAPSTTAE